ncbi:hypothetical protein Cha6605_2562 [Chamaesiphon minutus PCC 6605]|uniref:Uncharacterized protein n=1 Tax=Chamaesiphon minutus (strain ATCC 27169 / PCC 6605) TaxID=1173020 RepID=K9UER0_CHAP6|nr:hypothetical protein Cha6605_2562 [Chamaesiphon minutus PCC 6605]
MLANIDLLLDIKRTRPPPPEDIEWVLSNLQ